MNLSVIIRTRSHWSCRLKVLATSYSTASEEKIEIPNRIPRSSTDVLRALESTITRDPTAAQFKYHDDPYLVPTSNIGKRSFALAQEAGRKAAHWIRQEHSDLFQHKEMDPVIESFVPKVVYNEKSDVTEEDLEKVVRSALVSDAMLLFKLLREKGVKVSENLRQKLLELVCFYNSDDTLAEEFIEERWFMQSDRRKERKGKTWKDGGFAEEVFIGIDEPNGQAYAAMIQGMTKHYQVERAFQLYEESRTKGLVLNTNTYNALIQVANFLKEGYDMRWAFVVEMLTSMKMAGLRANLGTLNAVLEVLSTMGGGKTVKENVLMTLAEFKEVGVECSLASWYFVLITFCKERGPISTVLHDIITEIENKSHSIRDLKDTYFFVTAMDVCRNHLQDKDLAKRVDKLLHYGNNYDLLGDSYKESIYYRHYFILLAYTEPIEDFINNVYNKLVPHIYIPEPAVMGEILKNIDSSGAVEFLPKMWSDMTIFDHTDRENLLNSVLNIMINNQPDLKSELNESFSLIAWDIFSKIEGQDPTRTQRISFTGGLLGDVMILLLRNGDFEKANTVLDKLDKDHSSIVGVAKFEAFVLFVDACIEKKMISSALRCIQYSSDCGFPETVYLATKLKKSLTLDEMHLGKLSAIVGSLPENSSSCENEINRQE